MCERERERACVCVCVILLGGNKVWQGSYTAADQVTACWNSDFKWTPLHIHI